MEYLEVLEGNYENYHLTTDGKKIAKSILNIHRSGLVRLKGRNALPYTGTVVLKNGALYLSLYNDGLTILEINYVLAFRYQEFIENKILQGTSCTVDTHSYPKANKEFFIKSDKDFDELDVAVFPIGTKEFEDIKGRYPLIISSLVDDGNSLIV